MPELGPENASLTIKTGRAGLAARAGHDLVIEAERWSASVELDSEQPDRSSLSVTVDATALRVRDGTGGVKPLTDKDREEIQRNIANKVLQTGSHPEITFKSTAIHGQGGHMLRIEGQLTIAGVTKPSQISVQVEPAGAETLLKASATVTQSDFGIKPYTGLMGALKVADDVEVLGESRLPGGT